jgi:hypothetical protein
MKVQKSGFSKSRLAIFIAAIAFASCEKGNFSSGGKAAKNNAETILKSSQDRDLRTQGPVSDTPDALAIRLFASANLLPGQDSCVNPPATTAFVSTRLSPFAYCISGAAWRSPNLELCLEMNTDLDVTDLAADCWIRKDKFEPIALLSSGKNLVRLHVRDGQGNFASDDKIVSLDPGKAPEIRIISPDFATVSRGLAKSTPQRLLLQITDNDTPADKLKVIVQLSNPSGNGGFLPLACNFQNTKIHSQCPNGATQKTNLFTLDASKNTFAYDLTIPGNYNTTEPYVILITAIDQSGNAAVASTSEIGAGWEVVAGRTYSGAGGSGSTIHQAGKSPFITTDRRGTLYVISELQKISPFDSRLCKMIRTPSDPVSAADCQDIIISTFRPNTRDWAYNAEDDVFYAVGTHSDNNEEGIAEINFRRNTLTVLTGRRPKADLSTIAFGTAVSLSDHSVKAAEYPMVFDSTSKRLFFRTSHKIYTMDQSRKVTYVLGNGTIGEGNQGPVAPQNIALPAVGNGWYFPFVVTSDGRIIISGSDKAGRPNLGSDTGVLYLIENLDLSNLNQNVSMIDLSGDVQRHHIRRMLYDSQSNIVYLQQSGYRLFTMNLPPPSSPFSDYVLNDLISGGAPGSINDFLRKEEARATGSTSLPRQIPGALIDFSLGNTNYLYLTLHESGNILGLDLKTGKIDLIVGYVDSYSQAEIAVNRRLSYPRKIDLAPNNDVIVSDTNGIHRVYDENGMMMTERLNIPSIGGVMQFTVDSTSNRIIAFQSVSDFSSLDLNNRNAAPTLYKHGLTGSNQHFMFGYIPQFLMESKGGTLRLAYWTANWYQPLAFVGWHSVFGSAEFKQVSNWSTTGSTILENIKTLSHPDKFGINFPLCPSGCDQGSLGSDNSINAANFRMGTNAYVAGTMQAGMPAFFNNGQALVTCSSHPQFRAGRESVAYVDMTDTSISKTATTTVNSANLSNISTESRYAGMMIAGPGIPPNTHVVQVINSNSLLMSQPAVTTASGVTVKLSNHGRWTFLNLRDSAGGEHGCHSHSSQFYAVGSKLFHAVRGKIWEIEMPATPSTNVVTALPAKLAASPGTNVIFEGLYVNNDYVYYTDRSSFRVIRLKRSAP